VITVRRFQLERDEDASGVSGTGVVAQGVQFDDGSCAMRWLTATSSTAVYASADDVEAIHGHEGRTRLVWLDDGGHVHVSLNRQAVSLENLRYRGRRPEPPNRQAAP
jgi:hypothetical protein